MPSKARAAHKPKPWHVQCYIKWLRLKRNQDYRKASDKIKKLEAKNQEACEKGLAKGGYRFYDTQSGRTFVRPAAKKSQRIIRKTATAISRAKEAICQQFGLIMWTHPDDPSVTFENADAIIPPKWPVYDVSPWREVNGKGTRADEQGWLTLKVNLLAPLDETERMLSRILRAHRLALKVTKSRQRTDSDWMALDVWDCYLNHLNFVKVAEQLKRKVSTVKGQYVRACYLIKGARPTGSMKQRRVSGVVATPEEFQKHFSGCSRCQKANTPDQFCPRWAAYVNQDTKALRERLRYSPRE